MPLKVPEVGEVMLLVACAFDEKVPIVAVVDDAAARAAFADDRQGYAARFELDAEERAALVNLDRDALRERFAINPMLLYQLEARLRS